MLKNHHIISAQMMELHIGQLTLASWKECEPPRRWAVDLYRRGDQPQPYFRQLLGTESSPSVLDVLL